MILNYNNLRFASLITDSYYFAGYAAHDFDSGSSKTWTIPVSSYYYISDYSSYCVVIKCDKYMYSGSCNNIDVELTCTDIYASSPSPPSPSPPSPSPPSPSPPSPSPPSPTPSLGCSSYCDSLCAQDGMTCDSESYDYCYCGSSSRDSKGGSRWVWFVLLTIIPCICKCFMSKGEDGACGGIGGEGWDYFSSCLLI